MKMSTGFSLTLCSPRLWYSPRGDVEKPPLSPSVHGPVVREVTMQPVRIGECYLSSSRELVVALPLPAGATAVKLLGSSVLSPAPGDEGKFVSEPGWRQETTEAIVVGDTFACTRRSDSDVPSEWIHLPRTARTWLLWRAPPTRLNPKTLDLFVGWRVVAKWAHSVSVPRVPSGSSRVVSFVEADLPILAPLRLHVRPSSKCQLRLLLNGPLLAAQKASIEIRLETLAGETKRVKDAVSSIKADGDPIGILSKDREVLSLYGAGGSWTWRAVELQLKRELKADESVAIDVVGCKDLPVRFLRPVLADDFSDAKSEASPTF